MTIPAIPPASRPWRPTPPILACCAGLSALSPAGKAEDFAALPGLTAPQHSLAAALDQACPGATGALAERCGELAALNPAQQRQAIGQLTPRQFLPQSGMPIKLKTAQVDIRARLATLRQGAFPDAQGAHGGGAGDGEFRDGPLGLFAQTKFQSGAKDQAGSGFDSDTYGVVVGVDYRFTERLAMGLATGYTHTSTRMAQDSGNMDSDAPHGTLFGNYYLPENFYVDWAATYTRINNNLQRDFAYPGFSGSASSQPDADLYGVGASLGKDFNLRAWLLSPYVRFEYARLHLDPYQEQGGSGMNCETDAQTYESFIGVSGFQASHAFSLPWGVLTPSLRFEWEHQFANDNRRIGVGLVDATEGTGNFFLATGNPDRDYFNLGGAVAATLPGGIAAFLRCEARLGQTALSSQTVELGMRMPF